MKRGGENRSRVALASRVPRGQLPLRTYVPAEMNLESIGFFSAGFKRRYSEPNKPKIVNLGDGRQVKIYASPLGYPNSTDLDFYRALLKIADENTHLVPRITEDGRKALHPQFREIPLRFSTNQLIKYAGQTRSDHTWENAQGFLRRMQFTGIEGELFLAKTGEYQIVRTQIFQQAYVCGERMSNGRIAEANAVWPAPWFLSNFYFFYFRKVDLAFHQRLQLPIAKTLYPILDTAFYAATNNGCPYAHKAYDDLCSILFIPQQSHLSRLKQQLDPSHEELRREQFISRWEYKDAKDGAGVTLLWWPGEKWHDDQEQRKKRRDTTDLPAASTTFSLPDSTAVACSSHLQPPPLRLCTQDDAQRHIETVRTFFAQVGQTRLSKEKVEKSVKVLKALEAEGFSAEDINRALTWIVTHRGKKFGEVYSLSLLPQVIGQALQEPEEHAPRQPTQLEMHFKPNHEDERRKEAEQLLEEMPETDKETLRERAIESLTTQQIKPEFMLAGVVKSEMLRLLQNGAQTKNVP
jgi:hypothetical protein